VSRKPLIAANWKMYKTTAEARACAEALLPLCLGHTRDEVVICPPAISLSIVLDALSGSGIGVGAQNMHFAEEGAYTGEISAPMLTSIGVTHVIIGHSERRQYFCETDETVNLKLHAALHHGLTPIVCVGEVLGPTPHQPSIYFVPDGKPLIVRAEVEQEFADLVKQGMTVQIYDDSRGQGPRWTGKVETVSNWFTHRRSVMLEPLQYNDVRTLECIIQIDPRKKGEKEPLIGQRVRVRPL